ncbi:MAG: 50S ribosomal protein L25/general stress protein Ctc [Zoogloeaceae bacterium]|nr:50S ribosomal protein L25/general stress protein Ctc [Zoogloeaceae bacterium]
MQIEMKAEKRDAQGSGASRRLRRTGRVPAIIYGGGNVAEAISLDHNDLYHLLQKEAFHASVLSVDIEGAKHSVILRDTQWHAYRPQVLHVDFQRVDATHKMHLKVPLHFVNAEVCPGVKLEGGMVSHVLNEVDVECLPGNLPEFIEVDLKDLAAGHSIHISQLVLPVGVELVQHGEGDPVVATILKTKGGDEAAAEAGESA